MVIAPNNKMLHKMQQRECLEELSLLNIVRVKNSQHWKQFFQVPRFIYRKDPLWTPLPGDAEQQMFNPQNNHLLSRLKVECFLALKQGRPVGRISAVTDDLLKDPRVGLFGCFETIDEPEVARGLIDAAAQSLVERGKSLAQGPATLNTSQRVGLLIEGFNSPPQLMMPYNPAYYAKHLEENGFYPLLDLYSYLWKHSNSTNRRKLTVVARRASRIPGLKLRPIRLNDPWDEGAKLATIHNETMTMQWGFVPMSREEAAQYLEGLRGFTEPELLMFCEVDHKPVGVILMIPDLGPQIRAARNCRFPLMSTFFLQPKSVRVGVLSVTPTYRRRGVAALLIDYAINTLTKKGYRQAELSLIMDSNKDMNSIITNTVGCSVNKKFRVYEKKL